MKEVNLFTALTGSIRRMHHIQRYSSFPVTKPENVATHSWQVAFVACVLAWDLRSRGFTVDLEKVLAQAVMHDISEAMSGDVIRSYKYGTQEMEEACRRADEKNVKRLSLEFGHIGPYLVGKWSRAKEDTTEGQIVAFVDGLVVVTYCLEEHRMGNTQLDPVMQECYEKVIRRHRVSPLFGPYVKVFFPEDDWRSVYEL